MERTTTTIISLVLLLAGVAIIIAAFGDWRSGVVQVLPCAGSEMCEGRSNGATFCAADGQAKHTCIVKDGCLALTSVPCSCSDAGNAAQCTP